MDISHPAQSWKKNWRPCWGWPLDRFCGEPARRVRVELGTLQQVERQKRAQQLDRRLLAKSAYTPWN